MPTGNSPIPHYILNQRRNAEAVAAGASAPPAATGTEGIAARPEHVAELKETEKNTIALFPN